MAAELEYVPLPDSVKALVRKQWSEIKDAGGKVAYAPASDALSRTRARAAAWPLHCLPTRFPGRRTCARSDSASVRRRVRPRAPWADRLFAALALAAALLTLALAGRHHRVVADRRRAGDSRVRLVVPGAIGVGPGAEPLRRSGDDLRHADEFVHRVADRGAGELRHRTVPDRAVSALAEAPAGHRDRVAGCGAVDRLWHVGSAGVRADPCDASCKRRCRAPVRRRAAAGQPGLGSAGRARPAIRRASFWRS